MINVSINLKKLIRNPKAVKDMSLMSEIEENKSYDESSISIHQHNQPDIDMIELQNLNAICQKFEKIFNTS